MLLSCPGAYALQDAGELSRPGRGWPSSTWYGFRHAKGQEDQNRHLSSTKILNAVSSCDGISRRRQRHRSRDERRGKSAGLKEDNEGGFSRGALGPLYREMNLWREPQRGSCVGIGRASAPAYLVRDNDRAYGPVFTARVRAMGTRDRPISPGSPWQNGIAERNSDTEAS